MSKGIIKITNKAEAWDFISKIKSALERPNFQGVTFQVVTDKPKRSLEQNKYYWGVIVDKAIEFYLGNIRALITDLMAAMRFELTPDFIHELFKLMFNKGCSTAKLKTDEMVIYQDNIRHHFLHKYKIDIPPPNEAEINLATSEVKDEQH
ncbi:MAG: hypothetical protein ACRC5T_11075 [Cetobacterium sp.]